jgi:hypothetical protein
LSNKVGPFSLEIAFLRWRLGYRACRSFWLGIPFPSFLIESVIPRLTLSTLPLPCLPLEQVLGKEYKFNGNEKKKFWKIDGADPFFLFL